MRLLTILVFTIFMTTYTIGCQSKKDYSITSPDGSVKVEIFNENGALAYEVAKDSDIILESSPLGLQLNKIDLSKDLSLLERSEVTSYTDDYELLHGKESSINYSANEQTYVFEHASGRQLEVVFRVSNDGVAFRYQINGTDSEEHQITNELTSFNFKENTRAWLQPLANVNTGWSETNPSYEEYYAVDVEVGTPAPNSAGWAFPALFKTGENWVLISETGLDGKYPGTRLHQDSENGVYTIDFPQEGEQYPERALNPTSTLPWKSPWRIIAIGDLETITESTLGTDLANPSQIEDPDWIKPGRAAWSWAKLKDQSVNYDTQKEFIDYAAEMGWEYVLVDVNWDQTIGYDRISELADYAGAKEVGLLLWYNSSGDWNTTEYTPKSKLLTHEDRVKEFSRIQEMGIKGIKVDFFGGDGQSMIQYYLDIFKDAADHQLLVNTHGTTLPRGWHRTWPNLMTMESVKGFEFITFEQVNADEEAEHSAILPFTRNVFSPMDFTPMSPTPIPGIERITTPAFEIALPVLFTSGIQHYAETAKGMEQIPDFVKDFIREIPVAWDQTEFVSGFPGKDVIIARRHNDQWFVAGINGEEVEKELTVYLSFISEDLNGIMITDGESEMEFTQTNIDADDREIPVEMKPNGGFVMLFDPKL